MNENDLPTEERTPDQARDFLLATEAVREGYVRGWRTAAGNLAALVAFNTVAGMLALQASPAVGAYAILYGPLVVGLGFLVRGTILARRALQRRQKLPVWERHRIALTLIQVSKSGWAE